MYVESVGFKRTKESEWERGYYVGDTDNSEKSVFLDSNYNVIPRDKLGVLQIWDYKVDTENWIQFRAND
jgi:hypothetical protein|nr:hypothetical protein [uncultured Lachnoclostridium sp.]